MIDTHQHLIYPEKFAYQWAKEIPALQGAFRLEQYNEAIGPAPVEGTIFMEVDVDEESSAEEARFFCDLAESHDSRILGVIAAARPEKEGFGDYLDSIVHKRLVGIRRVLHTQPDALSTSSLFRNNIRTLAERNLTFDLCVFQRQLPLALELVQSAPEVSFVLDHCGVPDIASNNPPEGDGWLNWTAGIQRLAACPNVFGKISGITAYAPEDQHNASALACYIQAMIDAFGPDRLVWGGDWPVVNLGSGLARWIDITTEALSHLTPEERQNIRSRNARTIYHIPS